MLKSVSPDLAWPALIDPRAATVFGFLSQLQQSQWAKPAQIRRLQARQLAARLNHTRQHSRHFTSLIADTQITPQNAFAVLQALPILTRAELQTEGDALYCETPKDHGRVGTTSTSGSTGQPVSVKCTTMTHALRAALNLRGHLWHKIDLTKQFGAIRGGIRGPNSAKSDALQNWGGATAMLFHTGPSAAADITTPLEEQKAWLEKLRPATLMTYPSNLRALMEMIREPWPELEHVLTISETLKPDLRRQIADAWKVPVHDKYSSEELGPIAIECEHGNYHCSEHLIIETLRDDGTPCNPGEIGRLVVTDTYNFATALLRYDIRDYAELGSACPCGRGLPALKRIMGRVRNIMTLPDGRRFWPLFGLRDYGEIAPMRQIQFVQTALDSLLVRLVSERPLLPQEETAVINRIQAQIGYPLRVSFERVEGTLISGNSMKFEEFRSVIDTDLWGAGHA